MASCSVRALASSFHDPQNRGGGQPATSFGHLALPRRVAMGDPLSAVHTRHFLCFASNSVMWWGGSWAMVALSSVAVMTPPAVFGGVAKPVAGHRAPCVGRRSRRG